MSFCTDVKDELALIRTSKCCEPSLAYGFLLYSRSFSYKRICMQTANKVMADFFARLMGRVFKAEVIVSQGGEKKPTYKANVPSDTDRLKILAVLSSENQDEAINSEMLLKDCCTAAFVRGAFLACGSISDPETEYRMDFSVKSEALARGLVCVLDNYSIKANITKRGKGFAVYIKKNETIGDLLTFMGASNRCLEVLETAILKSVKNQTNRASNCDSGNISRTVEASIAQRTAIEFFEKTGAIESFPQELIDAAKLRTENPNASLKELCKLSDKPITVSGLNHRLRRIIDMYKEIKK